MGVQCKKASASLESCQPVWPAKGPLEKIAAVGMEEQAGERFQSKSDKRSKQRRFLLLPTGDLPPLDRLLMNYP